MRSLIRSVLFCGLVSLCAASAHALPLNPINNRPVTVIDTVGEISLQQALTNIFGATAPDADSDQSNAGMWRTATGSLATTPVMMIEGAGIANSIYGLFSWSDSLNALQHVPVFLGGAAPGGASSTATIKWYTPTTGEVYGSFSACGSLKLNCAEFSDLNSGGFGFYMELADGTRYYTADSANGGAARALSYQQGESTNWAIAFNVGADADFNDAVFSVESLLPVPEPGSLILFGSGLLGLATAARRRLGRP